MHIRPRFCALLCCLLASTAVAQCLDCPPNGDLLTSDVYDGTYSVRPSKPLLEMFELLHAGDPTKHHQASEIPDHWIAIPYGPLSFIVLPPEDADGYEFFLDGKPWLRSPRDASAAPAEIEWQCPALGRHLVQARYRTAELWSLISDPIRFEVLGPARPQIVALADGNDVPVPVTAGMYSVCTDVISLKLANVSTDGKVAVYLDGQSLGLTTVHASCCAQINIHGFAETGVHSLTVRNVSAADACGMTGEPSPTVAFHYFARGREITDVLLRQKNLQAAAKADKLRAATKPTKKDPVANAAKETPAPQVTNGAKPADKPEEPPSAAKAKPAAQESADAAQDRQEFCFFSTAHFPGRAYGLQGEIVDGEGLVIFEGMTLSTDNQGKFDLSFHTNTPDVPVTLRLQLLVKLACDGAWHTITLAPIRIPGRYERKPGDTELELQHHVRSGDIAALRKLAASGLSPTIMEIRRAGSARFGYERADVQYSLAAE